MAKLEMQATFASKGGLARAEALSPKRRAAIARTAATARWDGGDAVARADAKRRASLAAAKCRIEERIGKLTGELDRINAALQERANA